MTVRIRWLALLLIFGIMASSLVACGGTPTTPVLAEGQAAYTLNPNFSSDKAGDVLPYVENQDVKVGQQLPDGTLQSPIFFVPTGVIVYRPNPNWTSESDSSTPYFMVGVGGDRLLGTLQNNNQLLLGARQYGVVDAVLNIQATEFGRTYDGKILQPGIYHTIPNSQVTHVPAAIIQPGEIGLTRRENGTIMRLNQGYNAIDNTLVKRIPVGAQRYRTLSDGLFADPAVLERACASFKCETTIDHVSIAGTNIQASLDFDILFHFDTDNGKAMDPLWALGDLGTAVLNLIGSPLRSSRALTYTLEQLPTADTQQRLAAQYLAKLKTSTANSGLIIDQVLLRSVKIGDETYQAALSAQEVDIQKANSQKAVIAAQLEQQQAQFQLDDTKRQHDRDELIKDADTQAEVNKRVLGSIPAGMDPCLYLAVQIMQKGSGELPAACTPQRQQVAPAQPTP